MTSGSDNIRVLITSLFLTISIFALGLVAAHGLDFIRLNVLDDNFNNHVMNSDFLILEKEFLNTFDTDFCFDINNKLITSVTIPGHENGQIGIWMSTNSNNNTPELYAPRIEYITIESLP